jgi:hypothetical protein
MVMALTLVVVMVTGVEVWLLAAAVKLTGFEEALRVILPPPPPPEPPKVTVIVTAATPAGEVGVRVTVAVAPRFNPAVLLFLRPKDRDAGVVVPFGVTTSQLPEPEVSAE